MSFYALLVGIDFYTHNNYYSNLSGAVRDVNLVIEFLTNQLSPPDKIYKLVSPNPYEAGGSIDTLPTYENIINTFHHLIEIAESGDQIYIHYSGHGGTSVTLFPELKGQGQSDESIVPMDIEEPEGRYLLDVELATLLKRMVDKNLIVTLTMDSCHSGGATRGDFVIRGSEQVDSRSRSLNSLVASREELIKTWRSLNQNNPTFGMLPSSNYVFLAACRPSEVAYEYAANGYERYGALTYWMIDTLRNCSTPLTYRTLFNRINAKIQSRFPQRQLPMLIGDSNRYVFGVDKAPKEYALTVLEVFAEQAQIRLSAGAAQGLSRGMQFKIYPYKVIASDQLNPIAIAEIITLAPTHSIAAITLFDNYNIDEIEQGAPAVFTALPVELMYKVRLVEHSALDAVRQEMQANHRLVEVTETEAAHYQVEIASNGTYRICAGLPIPNLLPPIYIDDFNAAKKVARRLVHLSSYQSVLSLDNPRSNLTDALVVDLLPVLSSEPFDDSTGISIKTGEQVILRIKNKFNEPLNIIILDLEPTWEISQIPVLGHSETMYSFQPNEERQIALQLQLPSAQDYDYATETIKVFAMLGEADFEWLMLPPLDGDFNRRGLNPPTHPTALGMLLEEIGDMYGKPRSSRRARVVLDPCQDWVMKQILITVTR
jgi:Caspase domain